MYYAVMHIHKLVEQILYNTGINISCYNIAGELKLLKENLDSELLGRDITDIGCGDGAVSLKLMEILKPQSFKGVDVSPALVRTAKKRGVDAHVLDVGKESLTGDVGILWGVLHHFVNPTETLQKLSHNFNCLIIRESTDSNRLFELGHRLSKKELTEIFEKAGVAVIKTLETPNSKSIIVITKSLI